MHTVSLKKINYTKELEKLEILSKWRRELLEERVEIEKV